MTSPRPTVPLRAQEAAALLCAAVAYHAARRGIPLLIIKGVASEHHGLRGARHGGDVDTLTSFEDHCRLRDVLLARGWRLRPEDPDTLAFPRHSTTLYHPRSSVDIDLHFRIPGMEAPPEIVFARLWDDRASIDVAQRRVWIPDREASAVILALHALRTRSVPRHANDLAQLVEAVRGDDGEAIARLADDVGALPAVGPFLTAAYGYRRDWGAVSQEWRLLTLVPDPFVRRGVLWLEASARERLRLTWLAAFPPADAMRKNDIHADFTGLALARSYLRRWWRGLQAMPNALRVARRYRARWARLERVESDAVRRSSSGP